MNPCFYIVFFLFLKFANFQLLDESSGNLTIDTPQSVVYEKMYMCIHYTPIKYSLNRFALYDPYKNVVIRKFRSPFLVHVYEDRIIISEESISYSRDITGNILLNTFENITITDSNKQGNQFTGFHRNKSKIIGFSGDIIYEDEESEPIRKCLYIYTFQGANELLLVVTENRIIVRKLDGRKITEKPLSNADVFLDNKKEYLAILSKNDDTIQVFIINKDGNIVHSHDVTTNFRKFGYKYLDMPGMFKINTDRNKLYIWGQKLNTRLVSLFIIEFSTGVNFLITDSFPLEDPFMDLPLFDYLTKKIKKPLSFKEALDVLTIGISVGSCFTCYANEVYNPLDQKCRSSCPIGYKEQPQLKLCVKICDRVKFEYNLEDHEQTCKNCDESSDNFSCLFRYFECQDFNYLDKSYRNCSRICPNSKWGIMHNKQGNCVNYTCADIGRGLENSKQRTCEYDSCHYSCKLCSELSTKCTTCSRVGGPFSPYHKCCPADTFFLYNIYRDFSILESDLECIPDCPDNYFKKKDFNLCYPLRNHVYNYFLLSLTLIVIIVISLNVFFMKDFGKINMFLIIALIYYDTLDIYQYATHSEETLRGLYTQLTYNIKHVTNFFSLAFGTMFYLIYTRDWLRFTERWVFFFSFYVAWGFSLDPNFVLISKIPLIFLLIFIRFAAISIFINNICPRDEDVPMENAQASTILYLSTTIIIYMFFSVIFDISNIILTQVTYEEPEFMIKLILFIVIFITYLFKLIVAKKKMGNIYDAFVVTNFYAGNNTIEALSNKIKLRESSNQTRILEKENQLWASIPTVSDIPSPKEQEFKNKSY